MVELRAELILFGSAAVDQHAIMKFSRLAFGQGPIRQPGDVGVDQALFVHAPGRRMIDVCGMIENSNAVCFVIEWTFDGAPRGAFLLAGATEETVRVEMSLARI